MDRLQRMGTFVLVAELGSFAAAAERTGLSPAMVGNHVRYLEARLGARLLHRTTRRQALTPIGRSYYDRCQAILRDVSDAEAAATESQAAPRGLLRVTAPVTLGITVLNGIVVDYLQQHPDVELELTLSDGVQDLLAGGFEVAIRVGEVTDPGVVARRLEPYRLTLCASPAYLRRHGTPAAPPDLGTHSCLDFTHSALRGRWTFVDGTVVVPRGRLRANSGETLRRAALKGLGIIFAPALLVHEDVAAGRLTPILEAFAPKARPMHLLTLADRRSPATVRTFAQFVLGRLGPPAARRPDAGRTSRAG